MKSFIKYIKIFIRKVVDIMSEIIEGVEIKSMAVIYSSLIVDGLYTFKRVKKYWKSDVAVVLVSLGAEDKITDSSYLEEAKKRIAEANQVQQ